MKNHSFPGVLSILLLLACAPAVGVEKYAVIVGVNDYPHLSKDLWLTGSVNDALLMTAVVQFNGFNRENIKLLTNSDRADALPDKQNIVDALNTVASKAKAGDLVFVHMAGHGSQQPSVNDASEIDGLDETFLPRDVQSWDGEQKTVPNALTDNEFASLFENIRARGANLWVVFDSCHSGTITRSGIRMRAVSPSSLGIPTDATLRSTSNETGTASESLNNNEFTTSTVDGSSMGNLVVFSAAESHQQTPEMAIDVNGKPVSHGLFTYSLARALTLGTGLTYTDLSDNIREAYVEHDWEFSSPVISGTSLNSTAFEFNTRTELAWSISQEEENLLTIYSGYLQGLEAGDVIGLFDETAIDQPLFRGELVEVSATKSSARLLENDLVEPGMLALPIGESGVGRTLNVTLLDSVSAVMSEDNLVKIPWLEIKHHSASDISVHLADQRLWFIKQGQSVACISARHQCQKYEQYMTLQITPGSQIAELVQQGLYRIWQSRQLLQMPEIIRGKHRLKAPDVVFEVRKTDADRFEVPQDSELALRNGDELRLRVTNDTQHHYDVTLIFIGSDLSVAQLYPARGGSSRIRPGKHLSWAGTANDASIGREQIVALVIPATPGADEPDLTHLQQGPFDIETRAPTSLVSHRQESGFKPIRSAADRRIFTWTMQAN